MLNDNNFYIALLFFILIFVIAAFLIIVIYKLLSKVLSEESKKKEKVKYNKPPEQAVEKPKIEKRRIDYKGRIRKMAETDPKYVASIIDKWLKEK
jgi:flagellar biosynthesis/type III secretory pathway M-ring protein FliF/YscJ